MSRAESAIKKARTPKYCLVCRSLISKGERYLCFEGGFMPPNFICLVCARLQREVYRCDALETELTAGRRK